MDGAGICIEVNKLYKSYKNNVNVINNLSFQVPYGKIFGFLGPNGAGKTTVIKILTSLTPPSTGEVRIFGKDMNIRSKEIRKHIGIVMQKPSYEPTLTVEQSLDIYGLLWGIKSPERKKRINDILRVFNLQEIKDDRNEDLSIGQRRRVQIAREFLHDMDLLFLDEPTSGLDPIARRDLLDFIKQHAKKGLTIFFTTHLMEEVEYLCDEVAIIDRGSIVAQDTVLELKNKFGKNRVIEIKFLENISQSLLSLINKPADERYKMYIYDSNVLRIESHDLIFVFTQVVNQLLQQKFEIVNIEIISPSFEQIFLDIMKSNTRT